MSSFEKMMLIESSSWWSLVLSWFQPPRLLAEYAPVEIVPQGVAAFDARLIGWGLMRVCVAEQVVSMRWFGKHNSMTVLVPAGSEAVVKLSNLWGSTAYSINATTERTEVFVSHQDRFVLRPPRRTSISAPQHQLLSPAQLWGLNLPTMQQRVLPANINPELPRVCIAGWRQRSMVGNLEGRVHVALNVQPHVSGTEQTATNDRSTQEKQ